MNFYPFHLGDYASHTRHLGLLEDLAYRRMLDLYYTTENALPAEADKIARLIGMREHAQEVADVLSDFFVRTEAGYTHSRCEEELAVYRAKADRAKSANKARWGGARVSVKVDADDEFDARRDTGSQPISSTYLKSESTSDQASNLILDPISKPAQIATNNQEPSTMNRQPSNQNKENIKPTTAFTPLYSEVFEWAWEDYPKTAVCNKQAAYQAWNERIAEGVKARNMQGGAGCYGSYVADKQIEACDAVPAQIFFGPDRHYEKDWEVRPLWTHEETDFHEDKY